LARMYLALARRRGLEAEVLDDRKGGDPPEDTVTLQVSGAGAFALLASEAGLHQVTRGRKADRDGRKRPVDRDVVRVEVLPVPISAADFGHDEVRVEARPLKGDRGRLLARLKFDVQLFHVPTLVSVRAWSDGSKTEAVERLRVLLRARVEAARSAGEVGRPPLVRRYTLGPTTLVRDVRSGRSSGRLDQVLDGYLDAFLATPGP